MGLERIAAVMQGVHNNYDIDLFRNLIKAASDITGEPDLENKSLRVIADHIRSASFLIVDGVLPSNEGRGYVLRRIIRRALRQGHKLGIKTPFFTLRQVANPDEIQSIRIDRRTLPRGDYTDVGVESRQLFDIRITRHVTEFQAQVLEDTQGRRFVAPFPEGVTRPAQYGCSVKSHAVYLSVFQLVPYERIQAQFAELYQLPLSAGSLVNFNREGFQRLPLFLALAKQQLSRYEAVLNVDQTSVNLGGQRLWLHNASNEHWTLIEPHARRGKEAMDDIGILPAFKG